MQIVTVAVRKRAALLFLCAAAFAAQRPLPIPEADSAVARWLKKPVLESRLLDGMESLDAWKLQGPGEMTLTAERRREGAHSLRLRARTKGEKPGRSLGRPFGYTSVVRRFEGEDWRRFNRISFLVYPDLPGFFNAAMLVRLHNEGAERVPDVYNREGFNYVALKNGKWNHVVWEIAHLARDRVTALDLQYAQEGNEPEAADRVTYDFDRLELERVEPDHYEGWNVAPGRIAYSHIGYEPGQRKVAMASGLAAREFRVVDLKAAKTVLVKPVEQVRTPLGEFARMDFSELRRPGEYTLEAGPVSTRPFPIATGVWLGSVEQALNFFYAERCGAEVPGVHRVCHRDWQGSHDDQRMIINGGWHDAGDLSQGLVNTSEAVYAMFTLSEKLRGRPGHSALERRLVEEATWGLDWVLKTSFGGGYRVTWATMGFWTDGIMGTVDDVTFPARNQPFENFLAAAAEALAARVLKDRDGDRAAYSLRRAREDWQFAVEGTGGVPIEVASAGVLASVDLYRATREERYTEKAVELARTIYECQRREPLPTTPPLAGFFYTSPQRDHLLHYYHRGHEQTPVVALARLAEALPRHPDVEKWRSVVNLHAAYLKTMANFTEPYGMVAASIYTEDEFGEAREDRQAAFREQVMNGVPLGGGYRLRRFPVWFDFRGNYGVMLSQAKALATAGEKDLARRQLEWVMGSNPFAQSTMYGAGHDFAPQYTSMSGDIVGSLPVGIETRGNLDVPYWPVQNCYTYKEVWVHPASRWIAIVADLL